nr:DUF4136 domain-containing protein [Polymorphobacter sp.]
MTKFFLSAALALSLLGISVAAIAGPKASASTDRSVDLRQYKSFGFAAPLGTDQNGYQSILSQSLKASTQRQLEARGMVRDDANPQLIVNFNARLDDKMKVSTTPVPTMTMGMGYGGRGYYGYRGGMYSTWPAYQDQTTVRQYKEGTLNIDMVDQARKQLVWEAVVTDTFTDKKRDKLDETIEKYVLAAFKKFPVAAPGK